MIHSFKICGQRIVYDTGSCKAFKFPPLAFKMIESLEPPLVKGCPSHLRYSYAKYDSRDISEAYDLIYSLYESGDIFTDASCICASCSKAKETVEVADWDSAALDVKLSECSGLLAIRGDFNNVDVIEAAKKTLEKRGSATTVALHIAKGNEKFSDTVRAIESLGFRNISLELDDSARAVPELVCDEYERILKNLIKESESTYRFLPFDTNHISDCKNNNPACVGCWAHGICGGGYIASDCDIARKQIECALALSAINK